MIARHYYLKLALCGTGQEKSENIDIFSISNYLQLYAEKVAGEKWDVWLGNLGLSNIQGISKAINDLRRVNISRN